MGFTNDLLTGFAQILASAGVADWNRDGIYTGDQAGIYLTKLGSTPDRAIALNTYPVTGQHPRQGQVLIGLQARARGTRNPHVGNDLTDAVIHQLHGLADTVIGGIPVALVWHQSGTPDGTDDNGRTEQTVNFHLRTVRATAHTTE